MDPLSEVCSICGASVETACGCSPEALLEDLRRENGRLRDGLKRLRPVVVLDGDRGGSGSWHAVITVGGYHRFWSPPLSEDAARQVVVEANAAFDIIAPRRDPNWVHPCKKGEHGWDIWLDTGEVEPDVEGVRWRYRRECDRMGCIAKQFADRPDGTGRTRIVGGFVGLEDNR